MKLGIRLAVIAVGMSALVGCGGAKIESKEQAAAVSRSIGEKGQKQSGALMRLMQSGNFTGSLKMDCTHGGTVEFLASLNDLSNVGAYQVKYNGCTEPVYDDPSTEAVEQDDVTYDGSLEMTLTLGGSDASVLLTMTYKGRVDLSGAISDYVDTDMTYKVLVAGTDTSVTASFVLDGTIKTSTQTFTYANESWSMTAEGKVQVSSNP